MGAPAGGGARNAARERRGQEPAASLHPRPPLPPFPAPPRRCRRVGSSTTFTDAPHVPHGSGFTRSGAATPRRTPVAGPVA